MIRVSFPFDESILFIIIWYYLRDLINYYKTGDPKENDQNYWMFSYDFKDNKDHKNYWNKDILSQKQLFDTQKGIVREIKVKKLDNEIIEIE